MRTPEEIKAAREASRRTMGPGSDSTVSSAATSFRGGKAPGTGSAAKTDA